MGRRRECESFHFQNDRGVLKTSASSGLVARKNGDPAAALAGAAKTIHAEYDVPYLAHAMMEPLNCVVDLRADSCELWTGTQFETVDRANAAKTAGLAPAKVKLNTTLLGGGFGRRANPASDFIVEAVNVAKAAKAPVKVVWTREDDLAGGWYRPKWHDRFAAGIDAEGNPIAWTHTIVGQSIMAGTAFEPMTVKNGVDSTSVEGAADILYGIPNLQVDLHTRKSVFQCSGGDRLDIRTRGFSLRHSWTKWRMRERKIPTNCGRSFWKRSRGCWRF